ncbi:MAG: hypothetical protein IPJ34_36455 [Myxococcales bacterium]|nr:hypothetical protein [Myxococcales bacterium]
MSGGKVAPTVAGIPKPNQPPVNPPKAPPPPPPNGPQAATTLGYAPTNYYSHGQPVYTNGQRFITPDVDGHNGGVLVRCPQNSWLRLRGEECRWSLLRLHIGRKRAPNSSNGKDDVDFVDRQAVTPSPAPLHPRC